MHKSRALAAGAVAVLAVVGGLTACSGTSKSSSSPASVAPASSGSAPGPSASSARVALTIKNFSFSPTPLTAKMGDTIAVTNNDTTDHTVTDSGGAFDTGHIAPGTSKTFTLTKPGTYHYHCNIHPFMTGQIQVA